MSRQSSPSTGRVYGVKRVCLALDITRSTLYSRRAFIEVSGRNKALKKRPGPKPVLTDEEVLKLIRRDLEFSPFIGEGHRKVWSRLNFRQGHKIGRNRVLRIMREHNILSPHRIVQGIENPHNGRITTDEPNKMWGADGAKVETASDGWAWVFWAIEHWNAECVGWHVAKKGDRFAALEPVSQGVQKIFGNVEADVARGLQIRIDHGSQYKSEDFLKQVRFWGIKPSQGFVREPETNGVVERYNRTFKEQIIHGRVYKTIEELREAVGKFVSHYNEEWPLEKLGYKSPLEAREEWNHEIEESLNSPQEKERLLNVSLGQWQECYPQPKVSTPPQLILSTWKG